MRARDDLRRGQEGAAALHVADRVDEVGLALQELDGQPARLEAAGELGVGGDAFAQGHDLRLDIDAVVDAEGRVRSAFPWADGERGGADLGGHAQATRRRPAAGAHEADGRIQQPIEATPPVAHGLDDGCPPEEHRRGAAGRSGCPGPGRCR